MESGNRIGCSTKNNGIIEDNTVIDTENMTKNPTRLLLMKILTAKEMKKFLRMALFLLLNNWK